MRLAYSLFSAVFLLTVADLPARADVGVVSFLECEVNGYRVGTSTRDMFQALGEPLPPPPTDPDNQPFDVMNHAFDYDGLIVVFGQSLESSWGFQILSDGFPLKGGVGVGSTEQEVLDYYGPTEKAKFDELAILPYRVVWNGGQQTAIHLDFTIITGLVTRIDVHPRQKELNSLPY